MSIKVYIHYEPQDLSEELKKTSKLSIPKKWVEEKTVSDVIQLFIDSYNAKFPQNLLNKDELHLTTSHDAGSERIYSDDVVSKALSDHSDYFIKLGPHLRKTIQTQAVSNEATAINMLRCKNYGCNMFFTEDTNHDEACRHHIAPPIFHDRIKGWSCCKEKKAYDWDDFKLIEGCTLGRHSTEEKKQVFTESPTVAAASSAEARSATAPLKSIADYNTQNPAAATATASAVRTTTTRKSTRKADGTAKCLNKGCQQTFQVVENNENACSYHGGQPVFHDAVKYWSCCEHKKCLDFDEFMKVPGCRHGWHDDGEIEIASLNA